MVGFFKHRIKHHASIAIRLSFCYINIMTITQTVEIPAEGLRTIEVPREVPAGKVILTFTPVTENPKYAAMSKEDAVSMVSDIIEQYRPALEELAK